MQMPWVLGLLEGQQCTVQVRAGKHFFPRSAAGLYICAVLVAYNMYACRTCHSQREKTVGDFKKREGMEGMEGSEGNGMEGNGRHGKARTVVSEERGAKKDPPMSAEWHARWPRPRLRLRPHQWHRALPTYFYNQVPSQACRSFSSLFLSFSPSHSLALSSSS